MKLMKRFLIIPACLLVALSCHRETPTDIPSTDEVIYNYVFKATCIDDDTDDPDPKAVVGESTSGNPQMFWTDGDKITVYSSADGMGTESQGESMAGYVFSTSLSADAPQADFGYSGDDFPEGDEYIAIYPDNGENVRSVNFTTHKMAGVVVPSSQTLVAGSFDKKAVVAIAFSDGGSTLEFQNATALVKFQVGESGIVNGRIESESPLSGTFRGEKRTGGPYLDTYSNGKNYNYVDFALDGGAALTPGTDYYLALRPSPSMPGGLKVFLNGQLVKTFTNATSISRNKVYDLGVLSMPVYPAQKRLDFDFTDATAMASFPQAAAVSGKTSADDCFSPYVLDGVTYMFNPRNPSAASAATFPYYSADKKSLAVQSKRLVGLPAIAGYKLTSVSITLASNQRTYWDVAISSTIPSAAETPTLVTGGELQHLKFSTTPEHTYTLTGTEDNTIYYIWNNGTSSNSSGAVWIGHLTLGYEPVRNNDIVRVGTYNIRIITTEEDENNNWVNRKTRLLQSIQDNDFDVWGINECSTDALSYLQEELGGTYNFKMFSPYSQDGVGDKMQGIIYKKDFSLSNWHYFWLSDTPDVMVTNDGTSNRGGCCATLTRDGTSIFVMVTHGATDTAVKEQYAPLYAQQEALYNTSGYPSFFIGDMNARSDQPTSLEYKKTWNDCYENLGRCDRTGAYATYNAYNLSRNMYTWPYRLDYIYYKDATPLNYVCNPAKYDGYYASDHLPVYSDMRIR